MERGGNRSERGSSQMHDQVEDGLRVNEYLNKILLFYYLYKYCDVMIYVMTM